MKIDVTAAIASKNKKLLRFLPKCIIRWVERLIHQDTMNAFLERHINDTPIEFAQGVLNEEAQVTIEAQNEDNIPKTGRYIIVSNHPLGAVDGVGLIALLGRYRSDMKFPVNDLLMQLKPMHGVFIPINKHGKSKNEAVQTMNDAFASDDLVLYFPAGICSRLQNGIVSDTDWKKTVIQKAKQYKRDIIPVYFDGANSKRFYRIALWRKRLRIPFNLEMILLPDEMYRQNGNKLLVTFGEPITYNTFDKTKTDIEWAQWLKTQTYSLKNN